MQARIGDNTGNVEEELTSRTLQIQNKRFYLDVKQNQRGRFVKIAEVGLGGRKSRILMSMGTAGMFRDNLETLVNTYTKLAPHNKDNISGNGLIRSDTITRENRRYYLDLKENTRGRFLRVTMMSPTNRSQIAIPAQGIVELRNSLQELLKEYGTDDDESCISLPEPKSLLVGQKRFYFDPTLTIRSGIIMQISEVRSLSRTAIVFRISFWDKIHTIITQLIEQTSKGHDKDGEVESPESKSLRTDNKMLYFDVGSNHRGVFMRISEVRANYRTAITIPERSWTKVRDIVNEMIESMTAGGDTSKATEKPTEKTATVKKEAGSGDATDK